MESLATGLLAIGLAGVFAIGDLAADASPRPKP